MILNIQKEMNILINEQDWMDNESKQIASEKVHIFNCDLHFKNSVKNDEISKLKLNLMDIKIGYPDFTHNETYMDEIYNDVNKKILILNIYIYKSK